MHFSIVNLTAESGRRTFTLMITAIAAAACLFGALEHAGAMGVWCSGNPTIIVNGNPAPCHSTGVRTRRRRCRVNGVKIR